MSLVGTKFKKIIQTLITQNQFLRPLNNFPSPLLENPEERNRKYEITNDRKDWEYVERILPRSVVPEPTKKEVYPSGWKPQADNLKHQPYFVQRTKNHMVPVYLELTQKGIRRHTKIKCIQGDIWLLEKQLRDFLQKQSFQPIRSQVNELAGFIRFNGDFVNAVKYWLEQRHF